VSLTPSFLLVGSRIGCVSSNLDLDLDLDLD